MPFEFKMLAVMTVIFLVAWLPSSIAKWQSFGGKWLASNRNPLAGKELSPWGARAERAHANLKDNFPGFIVAILILGWANKFDAYTSWAAGLYVLGRIIHLVSYSAGNVLVRALSYFLALGANIYLLSQVF